MEQKLIKIGNSTGIIIPQALLKQADLRIGDTLVIEKGFGKEFIVRRKNSNTSSITLEFLKWLHEFTQKHGDSLAKLASR